MDELEELENYTVFGRYGDSEYAPPFCGASEIRPSYELALSHAEKIASKFGKCTLVVGNAGPIGDGDPFLPAIGSMDLTSRVHIRLANYHLRKHAQSTSLRAAWGYFAEFQKAEKEVRRIEAPINLDRPTNDVEVCIRRNNECHSAGLYVTNPLHLPLSLKWKQNVRQGFPGTRTALGEWQTLTVPAGAASYIDSVFQGEQPWVRQLRIRHAIAGRNVLGSVHLSPEMLMRDSLKLDWEDRGEIAT